MWKKAGISFLVILIVSILSTEVFAQCAMCRATLENNLTNGGINTAANINFGILYLFVMPYLAVGLIAFLWYKKSKVNDQKDSILRRIQGKMS